MLHFSDCIVAKFMKMEIGTFDHTHCLDHTYFYCIVNKLYYWQLFNAVFSSNNHRVYAQLIIMLHFPYHWQLFNVVFSSNNHRVYAQLIIMLHFPSFVKEIRRFCRFFAAGGCMGTRSRTQSVITCTLLYMQTCISLFPSLRPHTHTLPGLLIRDTAGTGGQIQGLSRPKWDGWQLCD